MQIAPERCATCIFRSVDGGSVPLTRECVAGLVANAEANEQALVCHERYDDPVVCHGYSTLPRPPERLVRLLSSGES